MEKYHEPMSRFRSTGDEMPQKLPLDLSMAALIGVLLLSSVVVLPVLTIVKANVDNQALAGRLDVIRGRLVSLKSLELERDELTAKRMQKAGGAAVSSTSAVESLLATRVLHAFALESCVTPKVSNVGIERLSTDLAMFQVRVIATGPPSCVARSIAGLDAQAGEFYFWRSLNLTNAEAIPDASSPSRVELDATLAALRLFEGSVP